MNFDSWEVEYSVNVSPPTGNRNQYTLETKLTQLQITIKRTDTILQAGQLDARGIKRLFEWSSERQTTGEEQ